MCKRELSNKYRLLKFRLKQLPIEMPFLREELDEIYATCTSLLNKWEKNPLSFGIAFCSDWDSDIIPANKRKQYYQGFVDKWIPLEQRLNQASAEISLAKERVELDPGWIKVYAMEELVKAAEREEENAFIREKVYAQLKSERSIVARRAADASHKTTNEQKAKAVAEWEGSRWRSKAEFARSRHKTYFVTERTLYGWILDHCKAKT